MNTLEALYFPGTEIYSGSQFPLFLLFGRLHLLLPAEPSTTPDDGADIFNSSGLCQGHTPCPLGEDLERFDHLVRDLKERKDDYAAQLSNLTVASMTAKKSSVDDTSSGIMATLVGKPVVAEDDEERENLALWQARLVLKIGEILDREEEEVAMQLALLEDDEGGLFRELQGELDEEEESLFAELTQLRSKMSRPASGAIDKRLGAWSALYRKGLEDEPRLWLASVDEAADIMLERYEEAMDLQAVRFLALPLPANIGWDAKEAVARISAFRQENDRLLAALAETVVSGEGSEELNKEWASALESAFPEAETGRVEVEFYNFAGLDCAQLLGAEKASETCIMVAVRWPGGQ